MTKPKNGAGLPAWAEPPCGLAEIAHQMKAVHGLLPDGVPHPARGWGELQHNQTNFSGMAMQAEGQAEQLAAAQLCLLCVVQVCVLGASEELCLMLAECAGQLPAVHNITRLWLRLAAAPLPSPDLSSSLQQ